MGSFLPQIPSINRKGQFSGGDCPAGLNHHRKPKVSAHNLHDSNCVSDLLTGIAVFYEGHNGLR